jgi:hypothetical protein
MFPFISISCSVITLHPTCGDCPPHRQRRRGLSSGSTGPDRYRPSARADYPWHMRQFWVRHPDGYLIRPAQRILSVNPATYRRQISDAFGRDTPRITQELRAVQRFRRPYLLHPSRFLVRALRLMASTFRCFFNRSASVSTSQSGRRTGQEVPSCFVAATWNPGRPIFLLDRPNRRGNGIPAGLAAGVSGFLSSALEPSPC